MAEYKRLFNIAITHDFYTDGISRDFDIVPVPGTRSIMKNNRLLFRNDNTGFRVLYQNDPGTDDPFIAFPTGGFELRFAMSLKNVNSFQNITILSESGGKKFESGNLIYLTNTVPTQTELDYSIIDGLKPSSFTYRFPQTGGGPTDTGHIVIKNENGDDVTPVYPDPDNVKADTNGDFYYPIDFGLLPPGLYNFETIINTGTPEYQNLYIDNRLIGKNIFGLIKIKVISTTDFPTNKEYKTEFKKRETIWRYKMILKTPDIAPTDTLEIIDGDGVYTFISQPDETTNGVRTVVFDSDAVIPYTQLPRKKFDFVKSLPGPNTEDILKNLANPPTDQVSAVYNGGSGVDFDKSVIYITV